MFRLNAAAGPNGARPTVGIVAALGATLSLAAAAWQHHANAQAAAQRFHGASQVVVDRLAERLRTYELGLRGTRGMIVAGGPEALTRERFERYGRSRDIQDEFPGATGIAAVWRVPAGTEAAFVAGQRAAGATGFVLAPRPPHPGDGVIVGMVEPSASNAGLPGLDLAADPGLRQAAESAVRSGRATLSAPTRAFDATGPHPPTLLLLLPIFRAGAPIADAADRRAASLGWTALPLDADRVLAGIATESREVALAVRDRDDATGIAATVAAGATASTTVVPGRTVSLPVYGRTWEIDLRARPAFVEALGQTGPGAVFAGGALLTLLAVALARRFAADARAAQRLGDAHARLAAIVNSSSDAIVGETLDGIVTDWNAGAESLFGIAAADAVGRPLLDLLVPAELAGEHLRLRREIARGAAVPAFDTVRRHRSGALLDVSVAASPIVAADGRIAGLAKTVRDIGQAKRAEREIREFSVRLEERVAERTGLLETARHDLQTVLDAIPTMVAYWDRDLRHRVTNRAYREWFGVDAATLRSLRLPEVLGPALCAGDEGHVPGALRGEPQTFERTLARADGAQRDTLANYLPDVLDGEVRGFYGFFHDVTEIASSRQRLAAALRDNEALLSTINLHAIVSVADRAGRIVDANEGFCRISGYGRDALIGQNHRIVNSGMHQPDFWTAMWTQIAAGRPWRGEICNRARDGSLYWVDSIIAPFAGADGKVEKYISIRFDISSAKRAEQALRASQEFLDRAGEIAQVGGWELDLRTMAITWSRQTCRIHDLAPDHQPDLAHAIEFYAPEGRPQIERAVERAMADGTPWDLELPMITATGRRIWARAQGVADLEDGKPVRLFGAFQDITERRQAALALQEANDRFALAAESAHIGVWQYDPRSGALEWDDRMYALYGRRAGEDLAPYALWVSRVHPDDLAPTLALRDATLRGERDYDPEYRLVWPNGEIRYIKASAKATRDAEGAVVRLTGVNIDVTERKRAETGLVETSQLLGKVLESASEVSIIATDKDLGITVFNEGAQRLLGYRADEIVGRATPILIHDAEEVRARAAALSAELGRPVEGGAVFIEPSVLTVPREWTYVRKDGSRVLVSLVVTAMHASDGRLLGYLGIAHDVTQQREQETSLRHAMHKATQASLAKSQFLANMSHEIRTPMHAVIGLSYLLGQSALDAAQADTVDKLRIAAKSLLGLINDVLDLSQIEAGELRLESSPFALRTVLQDLAGIMSVQAQAKRIGFSIDAAADVPAALVGDSNRLGHVLTNLVANAIKFTDRGQVRVGVRRTGGDGTTTARLRFDVEDTGIGIAAEVRPRLFAPFVQADASTKRRFGGTGLGLSIVQRVVSLMGGSVGVDSEPGRGSVFRVEIEFAVADAAALALPSAGDASSGRSLLGVRVLVTDDSDINLEVARRILELEGAQTALAHNGQEAVDHLRAAPEAFDVVLMDVQMPVLDGHEATRCIRDELGLTALPVIALTAGALTSEHQRAGAAGMSDFVTKPFDAASLVRTVLRHVRPAASAGPRGTAVPPAWPEIAGIDTGDVRERLGGDVALFRSMLRRMLDEFGDLDAEAGASPADDLQALRLLAGRMHKLKGSAGLLGAKTIGALADRAETACRGLDAAGAIRTIRLLASALDTLRDASAAAFGVDAVDDDTPADDAAARVDIDPRRLQALVAQLQAQSMSALDLYAELAPQLRRTLDAAAFRQLREHVDNLRFRDAAALLAQPAARRGP